MCLLDKGLVRRVARSAGVSAALAAGLLCACAPFRLRAQAAPPVSTTPAPGAPKTAPDAQRPSASADSPTDNAPSPLVTGGTATEVFHPPPPSPSTPAGAAAGEVIDRVIAVVNGDVILQSDVDEERRFAAFQPITAPGGDFTRNRALERLVNRSLILQQAKLQPQGPVTDEDVTKQLMQLRADAPACKAYHCETEAGWKRFVEAQGFTLEELMDRWRKRIEVLRFIELRFRAGVHIPQDEIETYYKGKLLPEYARRGVKAPPLDPALSDRIEEVLLQEQVSGLLQDWLKSLRAQGSVQIMNADGTGPT